MIKARTLQDLFKRYRRPGDLVFSIVFLVFCLFLLINLRAETTWSSSGKLLAQPAFWPYASVITMTAFASLHLISSLVSPAIAGRWGEVGFWLRSIEFAGWFIIYVIAVPQLGYLPATVIFAVVLALRLGYRSARMLLSAAAFGVVVVVVFKGLLSVNVPGGAIYHYLPDGLRAFMLTYF